MPRAKRHLRLMTRLVMLVLLSIFGIYTSFSTHHVNGQQETSGKAKSNSESTADASQIAADLDDAIKTLEKKDFKRFVERYVPVEILRKIRQENAFTQATTSLGADPKFKQQMVHLLKGLRKLEPTYDDSHGLATYHYDPTADGAKERPIDLRLPDTANLNMDGLGDDLKKVLVEGEKLLAKNQIQAFIERLYPPSALSRLKEPDMMQAMVYQLTAPPEPPKPSRFGRNPNAQKPNSTTPVQAMRDDFKLLLTLTPELTSEGQVAVYRINTGKDDPERVVKFQKVRGNWRFFDGSEKVAAEIVRQSKLKPTNSIVDVQFELIGGNWRFVDFSSLPIDR